MKIVASFSTSPSRSPSNHPSSDRHRFSPRVPGLIRANLTDTERDESWTAKRKTDGTRYWLNFRFARHTHAFFNDMGKARSRGFLGLRRDSRSRVSQNRVSSHRTSHLPFPQPCRPTPIDVTLGVRQVANPRGTTGQRVRVAGGAKVLPPLRV